MSNLMEKIWDVEGWPFDISHDEVYSSIKKKPENFLLIGCHLREKRAIRKDSFSPFLSNHLKMSLLRPTILLNTAAKAASIRTVPTMATRFYTVSASDAQTRVLDVVKGFEKVDPSKVNFSVHA